MPTELRLPELGENVTAGDVVRILVKPGDGITKDQPVLELETDKATIEVPSSLAGTVKDVRSRRVRRSRSVRPSSSSRKAGRRRKARRRRPGRSLNLRAPPKKVDSASRPHPIASPLLARKRPRRRQPSQRRRSRSRTPASSLPAEAGRGRRHQPRGQTGAATGDQRRRPGGRRAVGPTHRARARCGHTPGPRLRCRRTHHRRRSAGFRAAGDVRGRRRACLVRRRITVAGAARLHQVGRGRAEAPGATSDARPPSTSRMRGT